jgi:pyruvate dehydrogenase E2 component (dihydrolipoamide acetyltransferase)
MPALSPTMENGTLARWLVAVGDRVQSGDLLAEIETDKATMEIEAPDDGLVSRIVVDAGTEDVAVGTLIALPSVEKNAADAPPRDAPLASNTASVPEQTSVSASPLVRRIAIAKSIPLTAIKGSGPEGMIVLADLDMPLRSPARFTGNMAENHASPAVLARFAPSLDQLPVASEPPSGRRRTMVGRSTAAQQSIPHFYLTNRCRLDPLLKLRSELNESLAPRDIELSLDALLLKAMALSLVAVPDANVQFSDDELHRFARVDISLAVAVDGRSMMRTINDVAAMSLSAIAMTARGLAEEASGDTLASTEYLSGSASLINLGMNGAEEIFPRIDPPQTLRLGIGAGTEGPWKVGGTVALATVVAVTGTFDHRAIDVAIGAQFMAAFREHVEEPLILLG